MSQETNDNRQNNRQDGGEQRNRPNRNPKRHYRDIGDSGASNQDRQAQGGKSDSSQKQREPGQQKRQGGNQPPRNRRPRNRRPAQVGAAGPVERKETQPNRDNRNRQRPQTSEAKPQNNEVVNAQRASVPANKTADTDNRQNRPQRPAKPRNIQENRTNRWEKRVRQEETAEDIRRDIERIEKEIWLDIAGIHTIKLDF